ncbi:hypothetical protein D3C75_1314070 [compost metagenome]
MAVFILQRERRRKQTLTGTALKLRGWLLLDCGNRLRLRLQSMLYRQKDQKYNNGQDR